MGWIHGSLTIWFNDSLSTSIDKNSKFKKIYKKNIIKKILHDIATQIRLPVNHNRGGGVK